MTHPHLAIATQAQALEFGLAADEWQAVCQKIGRVPNVTELGIFSVMWSEHCSYKSSRKHLAKFPVTGDCVIHGPGENAGVIDIGDGDACIFKMESHNHPSFIEPYQGAATGVGGILRDVFTMGARPIALMNALRFGSPDHPKTRRLMAGVVAGIGGYGNCVGVPTVGGETNFHPSYNGNILVNVFCAGIARTDKIFLSAAKGAGNPVVYVGAKTGRDGIHGATMASAEFDDNSESQRPTVQVGDPFLEKLLIEACLELMATDAIIGIQDMGAAGLTSSSVEMASKGGSGLEMWMDKVPQREPGMSAYEMMLSESQERMLMTLKPGREAQAEAIFAKWGLDAAVIGVTTDTGRLVLKHHGQIVCDLPLGPLADEAPKYDRPYVLTIPAPPLAAADVPQLPPLQALMTLLACPDVASKRWIWERYDREVGNDTIADSGGDAAIVRVNGTRKALALTCDVTPRYVQADPFEGGKQAVAESWRNLNAVGARPLAITDNLNFGNPQRPAIMGQIVGAIEGMALACRALDYPVVSGNVSLYNETNGVGILPTPAVGGVGLLVDCARRAHMANLRAGDRVWLVGNTLGHLGQSLYLRECFGREEGAPPPVDLDAERRSGDFIRALIEQGITDCVHDLSDGGLLLALAELALASEVGLSIDASVRQADVPAHAFWFGEDQARYLVAVGSQQAQAFAAQLAAAGLPAIEVAQAGGSMLALGADGDQQLTLEQMRAAHEGWLPGFMSGALQANA